MHVPRMGPMQRVRVATGVRICYVARGPVSGVPLILLHGYTDSLRAYCSVITALPGTLRTIAITQRGHGDSDRPGFGYGPTDFAADLVAFMDALGIEQAVLAGHSLGSCIALRFALDYPERCRGLIVLGTLVQVTQNAVIRALWDTAVKTLSDPIDRAFVHDFQRSTLVRDVPCEFLDMVVRESLKLPARIWRDALEGLLKVDFTAELHRIRAPTLICWGDRDEVAPRRDQDLLLQGVPRAQLRVHRGGGHGFHWEDPAGFAADTAAFIEELGARAAA